jgi:hypothetical protein
MYKERWGIDELIVELMAVEGILEKCASGLSNRTINEYYDYSNSDPYILDAINEHFCFDGWGQDLDINPLMVYNRCNQSFHKFEAEVTVLSHMLSSDELRTAYRICVWLENIKKEIEDATGDITRF